MTIERMIELLEIEHECMLRGAHDDCDRKCADCELVQEDDELHEMYTNVVWLLKEQDGLLHKKQKDIDRLCVEISELKHRIHDDVMKEHEGETGHWIVLEYCANEGIYCSKCMNKIFDRSTKPKKKLSNYCPNCGSKNTHFFNPSTEKIMYSD